MAPALATLDRGNAASTDPQLFSQSGNGSKRSVFKLLSDVANLGFGEPGHRIALSNQDGPIAHHVSNVFGLSAIDQVFWAVVMLATIAMANDEPLWPWSQESRCNKDVNTEAP
jgi:hypothetical protein